MKYPSRTLGDLFKIKHGFAFKGEFFAESGEYVLLTPGNFSSDSGLILKGGNKEKYYTGTFPASYLLEKGDLVIALTDLTQNAPLLGAPAFIPLSGRYLHNQRLGRVCDVRADELDKDYLYYLLQYPQTRAQIKATATGATVRHTAPERICAVSCPMPAIDVQVRVASILKCYDHLIRVNARRIIVLEKTMHTLYREWFVDFRFSGSSIWNKRGGKSLPPGWKESTLGDQAIITMGQAPPGSTYNEDSRGLPFHQGVTHFGKHFPGRKLFCSEPGRIGEAGDVLFSVRAPVGRLNVAIERMALGRGLAAIRHREGAQVFTYLQLGDSVEEDSMGGGTIFKAVTKADVHAIPFLAPAPEITRKFEERVGPMWKLLLTLTAKNAILRATRDLLLPRLISGELDVSGLPDLPVA